MARRQRARRWAAVASLCLFLGAVTTVGVAWAFSYRDLQSAPLDLFATGGLAKSEGPGAIELRRSPLLGATMWYVQVDTSKAGSSVPQLIRVQDGVPTRLSGTVEMCPPRDVRRPLLPWFAGEEAWPKPGEWVANTVFAYGWPLPSLWRGHRTTSIGRNLFREYGFGHIAVPSFGGRDPLVRELPIRVLPRGLVIDTAAFAALWWLLLFAPPLARFRLRVSRGMCGACGYDLRGSHSGACPECGASSSHPRATG